MFTDMVSSVKHDAVRYLFHVELAKPETQPKTVAAAPTGTGPKKQARSDKIGRNDPARVGLARSTKGVMAPPSAPSRKSYRLLDGSRRPWLCLRLNASAGCASLVLPGQMTTMPRRKIHHILRDSALAHRDEAGIEHWN